MKNTLKMLAVFLVGGAVGGSTAYLLTKKHYETFIDTEINSAKQAYEKMQKDLYEKNKLEKERIMDDYLKGVASFGYVEETKKPEPVESQAIESRIEQDELVQTTFENATNEEAPEVPVAFNNIPDQDIYLISQDIIGGDNGEYEIKDLTYYSNGVFTNNLDEPVNPYDYLNQTIVDLIAQYDQSGFVETFVRNDRLMEDYIVDFAGYDFQEA